MFTYLALDGTRRKTQKGLDFPQSIFLTSAFNGMLCNQEFSRNLAEGLASTSRALGFV
jgi:hypothetical protein